MADAPAPPAPQNVGKKVSLVALGCPKNVVDGKRNVGESWGRGSTGRRLREPQFLSCGYRTHQQTVASM